MGLFNACKKPRHRGALNKNETAIDVPLGRHAIGYIPPMEVVDFALPVIHEMPTTVAFDSFAQHCLAALQTGRAEQSLEALHTALVRRHELARDWQLWDVRAKRLVRDLAALQESMESLQFEDQMKMYSDDMDLDVSESIAENLATNSELLKLNGQYARALSILGRIEKSRALTSASLLPALQAIKAVFMEALGSMPVLIAEELDAEIAGYNSVQNYASSDDDVLEQSPDDFESIDAFILAVEAQEGIEKFTGDSLFHLD